MVAQYFVMAGLLAWLVACRDRARNWAVAAGWFLGLVCFAKVDLLVLLSVSLLAFVAWQLLARPGARHARHRLSPGLALAAWTWPARIRRRACGVTLAGVLAAYAVNYAATTTGRLRETVFWLSWYVSWPVLILAAVGLVWLLCACLAGRARGEWRGRFTLVLLLVVSLHYLYDPLETGVHVWSMRRFVPVVLPLLMLVVSSAVVAVLGRMASGSWRVGVAVALLGLVARPSLAVVGKPLWDGALAQTAAQARTFPEDAVVLMSPGLAGTHVPTSLAYLHDLDTVLVQGGYRRSSRSRTRRSTHSSALSSSSSFSDGPPSTIACHGSGACGRSSFSSTSGPCGCRAPEAQWSAWGPRP